MPYFASSRLARPVAFRSRPGCTTFPPRSEKSSCADCTGRPPKSEKSIGAAAITASPLGWDRAAWLCSDSPEECHARNHRMLESAHTPVLDLLPLHSAESSVRRRLEQAAWRDSE